MLHCRFSRSYCHPNPVPNGMPAKAIPCRACPWPVPNGKASRCRSRRSSSPAQCNATVSFSMLRPKPAVPLAAAAQMMGMARMIFLCSQTRLTFSRSCHWTEDPESIQVFVYVVTFSAPNITACCAFATPKELLSHASRALHPTTRLARWADLKRPRVPRPRLLH